MSNSQSTETAETIIRDLHRIREEIVNSFGGDLHKLVADARKRQQLSGRPVWKGKGTSGTIRPPESDLSNE